MMLSIHAVFLVAIPAGLGFDLLKGVIGWLLGIMISATVVWFLAHRELIGQAFFGRVTFSYLGLEEREEGSKKEGEEGAAKEPKVTIDTLLDKRLGEVWIDNRLLRRKVIKAAQQCTEEKPFVILGANEMYHLKSGIRHQLSENYSEGLIDRAFGFEVRKEELLVTLCFTASKPGRIQKFRALVIRPDVLKRIGSSYESFLRSNPGQEYLLKTIKAMHEQREKETGGEDESKELLHMLRIYRRV